ncbi:porin [Aestuariibacter halophilus]|uniref:Porin n=1 Tax=Fluctibacter halophilus TaxID=226011 RepID=A0ABS8G374_9ALTE|nr:porin [Aestuariibacter halophilus]MCC2614980.1 porin [Aestuariibacter halophilus]
MKKTLTVLTMVLMSSSTLAAQLSPANPVLRPLTLKDGEVVLGASIGYGDSEDDNGGQLGLNAAYGITDDLTLGLGGIRYRMLSRGSDTAAGLELAIGAGLRGYLESDGNGDALGYGADVTGKYVFSDDFAVTFSGGYVYWNEQHLANKHEWRFSVGAEKALGNDLTAFADYSYRDLHGFSQNHANRYTLGVNYNLNRQWDLGLAFSYSDFDAVENGYDADNAYRRNLGIYATYRF